MAIYDSKGKIKVSDAKATVVDKLKIAGSNILTAINPFSKEKLKVNANVVKSNTAAKIIETAANHPFITAGVATAVVQAPTIINTFKGSVGTTGAAAATTKVASSYPAIKTALIAGGAGYLIGSLSSGSATTKASQVVQPTQDQDQTTTVQPTQDSRQWIETTSYVYNTTYGQGSPISSSTDQEPSGIQSPTQPVSTMPQLSGSQDTNADQDATAGTGINMGVLIAGAAIIYLLSKD